MAFTEESMSEFINSIEADLEDLHWKSENLRQIRNYLIEKQKLLFNKHTPTKERDEQAR